MVPRITVTNSTFDEAGYRNALSQWGASGFGIVVRDGQTPANLANLIISGNFFFDGGLAVVNAISANNSVLGFGSNTVNDVAFDTLTGGASADAFVFAKLGTADTITDYSGTGGQGDQIWLDDAAFTGLSTVMGPTTYLKQLAPGDFSTAFDPGKRIIYNGNALWYDADGVAGGAVRITNFSPAASPAPLASNILIF